MIQDIYPDKLDNHFESHAPEAADAVLFFRDGKLLARVDEKRVIFPVWREFSHAEQAVYAFSVTERRYFLIFHAEDTPAGYAWHTPQELRQMNRRGNTDLFIVYTAYHLWRWYRTSRFCGACGQETMFDTKERAKVCPHCGNWIYPRINPAVIVGVTNGDRILLTRYRTGYAHNALVAGFTEIGETVEETVRREVMEEVGLRVKNIRYYKSQPWGVAADILMGFYCDVDGETAIRMDNTELKYAEWVRRADIVLQPTDDSLTNEMMKMFKESRNP